MFSKALLQRLEHMRRDVTWHSAGQAPVSVFTFVVSHFEFYSALQSYVLFQVVLAQPASALLPAGVPAVSHGGGVVVTATMSDLTTAFKMASAPESRTRWRK